VKKEAPIDPWDLDLLDAQSSKFMVRIIDTVVAS
jgi:hypothetical protein